MLKFPPLHSRSAYRFELRTGSSCDSTIRWSLSSGSHQSSQSASPTDDRQVSLSRDGVSVSRLVVVGVGGGDGRDGQGTDIRDFLILQCEPSAARNRSPNAELSIVRGGFAARRVNNHTHIITAHAGGHLGEVSFDGSCAQPRLFVRCLGSARIPIGMEEYVRLRDRMVNMSLWNGRACMYVCARREMCCS